MKKLSSVSQARPQPPAPAPVAAGAHAIDALFDMAKRKKNTKAEEGKDIETTEEAVVKSSKKKAKTGPAPAAAPAALPYGIIKSNIEQITNPEAPVERIDAESGYRVYKAHLLKVGEGGGTELCPFDCNCCF